ncbi:hypothetical protein AX14_003323 [Amanita brunnescens Koide BX004]|nr:hypothetical protein AX14_003323 [Amanita brunnescens Koide BX004]
MLHIPQLLLSSPASCSSLPHRKDTMVTSPIPPKTRAPREIGTKAKSHRPLRERNLARQPNRTAKRRTVIVKPKKLRRRGTNGAGFDADADVIDDKE